MTSTTIKDTALREAAAEFDDGSLRRGGRRLRTAHLTPSPDGFVVGPTLLQAIADPGAHGQQALILCGDAAPILTGQRRSLMRVVTEITTGGTHVLLTPPARSPPAKRGFALDPNQYFAGPPGRGYLTADRSIQLMHLVRNTVHRG